MIYRLSSKFKEMFFGCDWPPMPDGLKQGREAREYEFCFEELPLLPTSLSTQCRVFKAPIRPLWRMNYSLDIEIRHKNAILPDFIVWRGGIYVTETVKEIIEQVDPFGHQYWPVTTLITNKKKKVACDKTYFRMNMRRYVFIESAGDTLEELDFSPLGSESEYIAAIQQNSSIRSYVETLPIWQHFTVIGNKRLIDDSQLYLNRTLMNRLKNAGVAGIQEYTEWQGKNKETVGHV
ncbi:hypothetical protein [Oleiphilus messinensis]|nr:hypothetical protein [Oleiphilus messinensis]